MTPHPRLHTLAIAVALGLTLGGAWCAQEARAGAFDTFGFGARALSMGGGMTAAADDHTGLFYNPAALGLGQGLHLGADLYTAMPDLRLALEQAPRDPALAPARPDSHAGVAAGLRIPIGQRVGLGLALGAPLGGLLDLELLDPQVPQWTRYDALPRKLQLAFGLGVEVTDWLHLGAGIQSLARIDGGARFELDLSNQVVARRDATLELIHTAAPTAGLLLTPGGGLRLGASWRGAMALDFDLPILFELGQDADVLLGVAGITLYTPHQLSAGLAWDLAPALGIEALVSLDLTWALWSLAPDPSMDLLIDVQGDAPEGLGLGEGLDFDDPSDADPGWRDTVQAGLGLEARATPWLTVRGGYTFRPAALEAQTGTTNYVDNDAHILGLGLGLEAPEGWQQGDPWRLDLAAQLTALAPRQIRKRAQDDPVGAYDTGGTILTLGLTLRR